MNHKPAKSIALCSRCRNNFYNGNNDLGVKECWEFRSAKVEKRILIGIDERPPYDSERAAYTLSCHKPKGAVQVRPDVLTKEGFWR